MEQHAALVNVASYEKSITNQNRTPAVENPKGKGQIPPPAKKAKKRGKTPMILIIAAVILVAVLGGFYYHGYLSSDSTSSSTQTWQQFGLSIHYPAGVEAKTQGVFEQQPTSDSGTVSWYWNQENTALALTWINATSFNYTVGFQIILTTLQSKDTNVTVIGSGNVTMAGVSWQFETLNFTYSGKTGYETCALLFLPNSERGFELDFVDTNSNTLNSLETYGNTLTW